MLRALSMLWVLLLPSLALAADWPLERTFTAKDFRASPAYAELLELLKAPDPNVPGVSVEPAMLDRALEKVRITDKELKWVKRYASPLSRKKQRARVRSVREVLVAKRRLSAGRKFAARHEATLTAASERYAVEVPDLLAMLNAESNFGKVRGSFVVFDVFVSQIAYLRAAERAAKARGDYDEAGAVSPEVNHGRVEKRRNYALQNISALLRHAARFGQDPRSFKGSWAGAIGITQFMPASLRFAEDGNEDGRIDLDTIPDAIHSTARFLVAHGYERGNDEARKAAFHAYNPNSEYVRAIDLYAKRYAKR